LGLPDFGKKWPIRLVAPFSGRLCQIKILSLERQFDTFQNNASALYRWSACENRSSGQRRNNRSTVTKRNVCRPFHVDNLLHQVSTRGLKGKTHVDKATHIRLHSTRVADSAGTGRNCYDHGRAEFQEQYRQPTPGHCDQRIGHGLHSGKK
jgi:hypothetical protein